jgi:hypothetical protein
MSNIDGNLEAAAIIILKSLIQTFGATVVQQILDELLSGAMIGDVGSFVGSVLQAIITTVGEERVRAEVVALYNAADIVADAVENNVFGKGGK